MSEYAIDINMDLYKYSKRVDVTEITGTDKTFIPLKLNLNEHNFNFDLAREDGLDFRLCEGSNGTGVLQMWIAYWDKDRKRATLWFKLPSLLANQTKRLWAFWGNEYDGGISDLKDLLGENLNNSVFLFGDDFDDDTLSSTRWPTTYGSWSISDSTINLGTDAWIRSPQVLPGQVTNYTGSYIKLTLSDGMWGSHQSTASCYLNWNDVYLGFPSLVDGIVNAQSSSYAYVSSPGCALGVDLGSTKDKISKVRIYIYADGSIEDSWNTDSYIELYGSDSLTPATDYTYIYTYPSATLSIIRVTSNVIYFDLDLDAPGIEYRYLLIRGRIDISYTGSYRRISEIEVYQRNSIIIMEPGNFILEEGIIGIGSPSSTTVAAHRYRFYGGENVLGINYFWDGSTDRTHDFVVAGTYVTYNGTNRGLEKGSYSRNYIAYYEPTDRVYQGMHDRATYADYDDSWERKVHRNTEVSNFRIYGEDTSAANGVKIDWVVARRFEPESEPIIDYSNLWVDYEYVGHQQIDTKSYGGDVTDIDFYHYSDMGGDPYRMSDNISNSISNVFISDGTTTFGNLIIDFGRMKNNIANKNYLHLDSGTVEFYNASKLSDLDTDVNGRDYWAVNGTYGWAAILFPSPTMLSCLSLTAVSTDLDGMAQNFRFYGSNTDPRYSGWSQKVLLYEGTARRTAEEQHFYISTAATYYTYYILEVLDTYGSDIKIQEWGMFPYSTKTGKKVISQLRLLPVAFDSNEPFFVKEIELYGSNDGFNWDLLLPRTDTPTPFTDYIYGRWSRYSFTNSNAYYQYKLVCYDNWDAPDDRIKIAEWEMVELAEEVNNIRVLGGTSNNINNIWADPTTNVVSGTLYITNEVFNTIEFDKLIVDNTVSGTIADFNVKL